jgi:hypothetical protein
MGFTILDGTGNGLEAGVTTANELRTRSRTESLAHVLANEGKLFLVSSTNIALTTTGSYNGIIYGVNSGTLDVQIYKIFISSTVNSEWKFNLGCSAGTLVSSGTATTAYPTNTKVTGATGSSWIYGANGLTITDGLDAAFFTNPAYHNFEYDFDGSFNIGPGGSIAMLCKPASSGNVSFTMLFAENIHEI